MIIYKVVLVAKIVTNCVGNVKIEKKNCLIFASAGLCPPFRGL